MKSLIDKLRPYSDMYNRSILKLKLIMNREDKIKQIKQLRVTLQSIVEEIAQSEREYPTPMSGDGFYSASIAKRKIKEARMWLGMSLNALGNDTPYTEADNPGNATVHKEADVPLTTSAGLVITDTTKIFTISLNKNNPLTEGILKKLESSELDWETQNGMEAFLKMLTDEERQVVYKGLIKK